MDGNCDFGNAEGLTAEGEEDDGSWVVEGSCPRNAWRLLVIYTSFVAFLLSL